MGSETEEQRAKRHAQRVLFGSVADSYESFRRGYPAELLELMVDTSGVRPGAAVLEVGCGTGQLTRQLVPYGFAVTALDIGPAMIAVARRQVSEPDVTFEATPFESFDGREGSFELIVSATAFHWVDPDVGWSKVARLLRPGGWLALLETGERYDEPLGSAVREVWINHSPDGGAWAKEKKPTFAETIADTGLFAPAIARSLAERITLPAGVVAGVERTRATFLSYDEPTRQSFTKELRALLEGAAEVALEQQSSLTMAQVLARQ